MSARYQIIHFVPDPFSGARIPIAALVEADGRVQLAEASHVPSAQCLGSTQTAAALRMIRDLLMDTPPKFGRLPNAVGPMVVLDQEQRLPAGVEDPAEWIRSNILPRRAAQDAELPDAELESPRRATWGRTVLANCGVERFLKQRFRPPGWREESSPVVSHFVEGTDRVLLMEPLLGSRRAFEKEAAEVNRTFLALRGAEARRPHDGVWRYLVYLQPSETRERNAEVRSLLEAADDIVDLSQPRARDRFIEQIREVGLSAVPSDTSH